MQLSYNNAVRWRWNDGRRWTAVRHLDFSALSHASHWHPQSNHESPSASRRCTWPAAAGCVAGRRSPFLRAVPSEYASAMAQSRGQRLVVTTVEEQSTRSPAVSRRHCVGSSQTVEESNLMLGVTSLKTVEHTNTHTYMYLVGSVTDSLNNSKKTIRRLLA